jgi:subtilase family serine protease
MLTKRLRWPGVVSLLGILLLTGSAFAQLLPKAQLLGPEVQSKSITLTVWLNQHNKGGFDALVRQMYDKNSPNYHHWLTMSEYNQRFAPTKAEMAEVQRTLAASGLQVVSTEKNNHFLVVRGPVAAAQRAFGVQINRASINGRAHRVGAGSPALVGAAGSLVAAVQGISDLGYKNHAVHPVDPDSGLPFRPVPLATSASPSGLFFARNCFRPPQTRTFRTKGGGPSAVYSGNRYGSNITSGVPNLPPCGYDSNEIQKAYGLKDLYKQKFDGRGQTVAIVDAFGSDTIVDDANVFSGLNQLPALTPSNFQIYTPNGSASCNQDCIDGGWNIETTLDVEWAHVVAPKANIALVLAADNTFTNLDIAVFYAIENQLANVISGSYGIGEIVLQTYAPSELVVQNSLSELAAALGISTNFSTGDDGDFYIDYGVTTVGMPAAAPYATAVGGTSLFLNPDKTVKFQTGWGNNETRIADYAPNPPTIPPLEFGFIYGAGGGNSAYWKKPSYQKHLKGPGRHVPDISYVADPYTGVEIIFTDPTVGEQFVGTVGGTSLACPMFSALWAIANQAAGAPLGQAAPLLYTLGPGAVTDVTAMTSPYNVSGIIFNPPNPPMYEGPSDLVQPLQNTKDFVSALYNGTSTRWYVLSFGTDSSLTTAPGWDNVTGLGTPNGPSFIQAVTAP